MIEIGKIWSRYGKKIVKDPLFLAQKSEPATEADK